MDYVITNNCIIVLVVELAVEVMDYFRVGCWMKYVLSWGVLFCEGRLAVKV